MFMITFMAACGGETNDNANENENNDDVKYSEAVDYTITGIEPGAGISVTTERALEEYDELQGWEVELSSTGAMMSELDTKIENEERSEEHTSELQSRGHLVCRLLLEKNSRRSSPLLM